MSKRFGRTTTLLLAFLTFMAMAGLEQGSAQILAVGGHVSMNQDINEGETTWGMGARAHLSLPLIGFTLQGTADFFNPDCDPLECEFREISLNVLWSLPVPWVANPYLGAGLAAQNSDGDWALADQDDYGVNFLAGIVLQGPAFSRFQPFGEVKYQVMKDFDPQTVFNFGVLLNLL